MIRYIDIESIYRSSTITKHHRRSTKLLINAESGIIIPYYAERQHKKITAVRIKIQKAKTIKSNTIKSAHVHNTGHFSLDEQMTVHNHMHITIQNKKLTCVRDRNSGNYGF